MSGYSDGRRVEYAVIHHLKAEGYEVLRAAGSKGVADLICFKPGEVLIVNVKRSTPPGPGERAALLDVSRMLPGVVPLIALKPPRRPLEFRRLTGMGPADWTPWTTDLIEGDR